MADLEGQFRLSHYNRAEPLPQLPERVIVCDVTLREGDQSPGVALSVQDKMELARHLDAIGVAQVQLGRIQSKESEREAQALSKLKRNYRLEVMTFGNSSTWKEEVRKALDVGADVVHSNLAVSPHTAPMFQVMSEGEYVERAGAIIDYAKGKGAKEINISLPDATRTPWVLLEKLIVAICEAGASRIRIPDSVGTATPRGMFFLTHRVRELTHRIGSDSLPIIGSHCHNDLGLATANTVAAVEAGAGLVDLAVNGLGERAGNADLAEVVTILESVYGVHTGIQLPMLMELSQKVEEITGRPVPTYKPLIGRFVFSDQEAKHIDAFLKDPFSFQGINPELMGNERRFLLGKLSGKTVIRVKAKELGLEIPEEKIPLIRERIVSLAYKKKGAIIKDQEFTEIVRDALGA